MRRSKMMYERTYIPWARSCDPLVLAGTELADLERPTTQNMRFDIVSRTSATAVPATIANKNQSNRGRGFGTPSMCSEMSGRNMDCDVRCKARAI